MQRQQTKGSGDEELAEIQVHLAAIGMGQDETAQYEKERNKHFRMAKKRPLGKAVADPQMVRHHRQGKEPPETVQRMKALFIVHPELPLRVSAIYCPLL
ncbi:hypothetical protein D3C86_1803990 [compost metagenome]